ncbi:MAG: DUF3592 domain-containing protein [Bryobacteraceae bacterium]
MLIAGLALLAFSLVFVAAGIWFYRKVQQVKTWPSVSGTILEAGVVRKVSKDEEGNESVGYALAVTYQYAVAGQSYTGTRIALAETTHGSHKAAENQLAKYPLGGTVQVKYDPAAPGSALLEESGALLGWIFAGIGIVIAVIGIVLLALS